MKYVRFILPFILNRADAVRLLYPTQVDSFQGLTHREHYRCFHDFVATSLYGPGTGDITVYPIYRSSVASKGGGCL